MDIHTTSTTEITENASWRDGPVFKTLEALRPWIQWALIGVLALVGMYLYQRDTNAQNTLNLTDLQRKQDLLQKTMDERTNARTKEINELKDRMVTKELFEERTGAIKTQVGIIDNRTIEILNRLPVRAP